MEIELILRISAIVIASMLLFTNINIFAIITKIKTLFTFSKPVNIDNSVDTNNSTDFLEIIDLWYKLKNKCESKGLTIAVEELDKVFPLLNIDGDKNVR